MIKFNKNDIVYTSEQDNDGLIITVLDDNQFYLLKIEINKNIQIKCFTPLASSQNPYKVVIDKNNLLSSLLEYLFNNTPTLPDSFNNNRYLKVTKDINDNYIIEMSKEACIDDDVFYSVTICPRKVDSRFIEQINDLQNNLKLEATLNKNDIKPQVGITKTLYRKAV